MTPDTLSPLTHEIAERKETKEWTEDVRPKFLPAQLRQGTKYESFERQPGERGKEHDRREGGGRRTETFASGSDKQGATMHS